MSFHRACCCEVTFDTWLQYRKICFEPYEDSDIETHPDPEFVWFPSSVYNDDTDKWGEFFYLNSCYATPATTACSTESGDCPEDAVFVTPDDVEEGPCTGWQCDPVDDPGCDLPEEVELVLADGPTTVAQRWGGSTPSCGSSETVESVGDTLPSFLGSYIWGQDNNVWPEDENYKSGQDSDANQDGFDWGGRIVRNGGRISPEHGNPITGDARECLLYRIRVEPTGAASSTDTYYGKLGPRPEGVYHASCLSALPRTLEILAVDD